MSQPSSTPEQRAEQMKQAIEDAQRALNQSKSFFEDNGLNSDKAQAFLASKLDDKSRADAQRLFEQDMQEVEQQAHEQAARDASAAGTSPRRPRPMV